MHNISIDSRERVNIIIEWILRSSVDKIKEEKTQKTQWAI